MRYTPLKKYQLLEGTVKDVCTYCGNRATQTDHVPPVSLQYHYQNTDTDFYLIPSCRECNSALGGRDLETVKKRLLFLLVIYCKRYPDARTTRPKDRARVEWIIAALRILGVRQPFEVEQPQGQKVLFRPLPGEIPQREKKSVCQGQRAKNPRPRSKSRRVRTCKNCREAVMPGKRFCGQLCSEAFEVSKLYLVPATQRKA